MHNTDVIPLIAGFALDSLIGDPYKMPHPIKGFGHLIAWGESRFNAGEHKKAKGALLTISLVIAVFVTFSLGQKWLAPFPTLSLIILSLLVFWGLANHSLIKEGLKVIHALEKYGLEAGRKQVAMIVGRDTSKLSPNEIKTAVLETLAENLSDGVIAPLFYYAIGGVPLMFTYKMINTLDSMIGYKSERYKDFGYFAAKLDDVANYIPARLTALLMVMVTFSYQGFQFILKYGHKHSSPNAGYPEAALAGILNCRFGGPNAYHGKLVDKPFIGENPREKTKRDIYKACLINACCTLLFIVTYALFLTES